MSIALNLPLNQVLNQASLIDQIRVVHPRVWKCSTAIGHIHAFHHNFGLFDTLESLYNFIDEGATETKVTEEDGALLLHRSGYVVRSNYTFYGLTDEEKDRFMRRYPDQIEGKPTVEITKVM